MIVRNLVIAIALLLAILALQTWRLDNCQKKADRLETCQEVDALEQEVQNATDDALADSISDPGLQ